MFRLQVKDTGQVTVGNGLRVTNGGVTVSDGLRVLTDAAIHTESFLVPAGAVSITSSQDVVGGYVYASTAGFAGNAVSANVPAGVAANANLLTLLEGNNVLLQVCLSVVHHCLCSSC